MHEPADVKLEPDARALAAPPAELVPTAGAQVSVEQVSVEIGVHDASRFEWRVSVPLPTHGHLQYVVDAEFELPSTSVSRRYPWDQLEGITRVEGPQGMARGVITADSVRRRVLALLQMLRSAGEGFGRHCREVSDLSKATVREGTEEFLTTWLDASLAAVASARAQIAEAAAGDSDEVRRERELADEFISVRLLDMLAEAQAILDASVRPVADTVAGLPDALAAVDARLGRALDAELRYRQQRRYPIADAASSSTLERYVDRAGRLKRHFEAVLVLDREMVQLDDRLNGWFASFGALLAGACAFLLQLALLRFPMSSGSRLGWSLLAVALLAGAVYAMRDRIKEISRAWLTGKVYRFYAQRIVRCRTVGQTRAIVVQAREWCNETTSSRPDPINPESGSSLPVTLVNHVHRGTLISQPSLVEAGVKRIRQVFRYDLSPLFPRLQDPIKRVPVLDPYTGRPQFIGAPRRYQIPLRVLVTAAGEEHESQATLVVDKQGIVRLDWSAAFDPDALVPTR